jgi:hypothetical protein
MNDTAYAVLVYTPEPDSKILGIGVFSDPTPNVSPNHYVVVDQCVHADGYEAASKELDKRLKGNPVHGKLYKGLRLRSSPKGKVPIDYTRQEDGITRAEIRHDLATVAINKPHYSKGVTPKTVGFYISRGDKLGLGIEVPVELVEALREALNAIAGADRDVYP